MIITLNGQKKELPDPINLDDMISQINIKKDLVVAEVNGDIIQKQNWSHQKIADGDTIELLNFVGGGEEI